MRRITKTSIAFLIAIGFTWILPIAIGQQMKGSRVNFPYEQVGLTSEQAAAHLLDRFSYGATPGQAKAVANEGLEKWFEMQLNANAPEDTLQSLLAGFDALHLSNEEIAKTFPAPGQIRRKAIKEGVFPADSLVANQEAYRKQLGDYMDAHGFRPRQQLYRQLIGQKIYRAAYGNNQLLEVMTTFWFNHFNVSLTKNQCAPFIPAYERDVIRPNALGNFSYLLLATAKSPAMLFYLDNFSSSADNSVEQPGKTGQTSNKKKRTKGINENYAREVMELHTLGVDGGYTQEDVTEAARVLTGWTVVPMDGKMRMASAKAGSIHTTKNENFTDGDFLFAAKKHDKGKKTVLGQQFGPNGGYQEGVKLLEMLAHKEATAKFISRKLAVRFVSDDPPKALIDRMAGVFLMQNGDIKAVLKALVISPEFWETTAVRQKTKSPFELAINAVRNLDAQINDPYTLYQQISKMGEKFYYYQAPTGFPDRAQYWINTSSLLNRMNFGLAFASGRIRGITVDLPALNDYHEPESSPTALKTYGRLMMPGRNLDPSNERLTPMLNDPKLQQKVNDRAAKHNLGQAPDGDSLLETTASVKKTSKANMLAQVVGIIIGSPEYQRR